MPENVDGAEQTDYALVDAGELRRLERFGSRLVDRPAPTAHEWKQNPSAWQVVDLRFDPEGGWSAAGASIDPTQIDPWSIPVDGLTLEVRPTASGGMGVYPEHRANIEWLENRVRERVGAGRSPTVLNLFAHTGLLTLAAARAGAAVTHVDSARGVVAWARRNAELSGLADRPIRWLVDDAAAFVAREARRGRRYDGIMLDPPSFGHASGHRWRLADELPALLAACREVATDDAFALLTAHTTGIDGAMLEVMLRVSFPSPAALEVSVLELAAESGAHLDLGWSVRLTG